MLQAQLAPPARRCSTVLVLRQGQAEGVSLGRVSAIRDQAPCAPLLQGEEGHLRLRLEPREGLHRWPQGRQALRLRVRGIRQGYGLRGLLKHSSNHGKGITGRQVVREAPAACVHRRAIPAAQERRTWLRGSSATHATC